MRVSVGNPKLRNRQLRNEYSLSSEVSLDTLRSVIQKKPEGPYCRKKLHYSTSIGIVNRSAENKI